MFFNRCIEPANTLVMSPRAAQITKTRFITQVSFTSWQAAHLSLSQINNRERKEKAATRTTMWTTTPPNSIPCLMRMMLIRIVSQRLFPQLDRATTRRFCVERATQGALASSKSIIAVNGAPVDANEMT
jgi:hypothetical protein